MKYILSKGLDANQAAYAVMKMATEGIDPFAKPDGRVKNPAAVALGRLGAAKGGKARAKALSAARRKEIARRGGENRWKVKV